MKLTCGCLNVQINTKCKELKASDVRELGISNGNPDPDQFFQMDLAETALDLAGIRIEHMCLVKQRTWENWTIHRCLNCDWLTHAVNNTVGNGKVLVNTSLKSDPTIQESLMKSPDFSPLYKIVIHSKNDNYQVKSLGLESGHYESLRKVLSSIQQQLDSFLLKEEAALEARIRKYEEQQRSQFAEIQSKVRRDKNVLISLVLASEEGEKSSSPNSNQEPKVEKPIEPKPTNIVNKVKPPTSLMQPKQSYSKPEAKKGGELDVDINELDVFDMEDVNDDDGDGRAFYMSDDENDDTDDSTNEEVFGSKSRTGNALPFMSSSMPVSVPEWGPSSHGRGLSNVNDEDDFDKETAPKDLAASIKALAQSVHGDGTEIFGDLPRRPRNAMDMGNI